MILHLYINEVTKTKILLMMVACLYKPFHLTLCSDVIVPIVTNWDCIQCGSTGLTLSLIDSREKGLSSR